MKAFLRTLFLFCLTAATPAFGQFITTTAFFKGFQSGHSVFQWTTSNGLPQSSVAGITQTSNRLMWIGTKMGVSNFDGKKFNVLPLIHFGKQLSPEITAINAVGDTVIWASKKELVIYHNGNILKAYRIPYNEFPIKNIIIENNLILCIGKQSVYRIFPDRLERENLCKSHITIAQFVLFRGSYFWTTDQHPNILYSRSLSKKETIEKKQVDFVISGMGSTAHSLYLFDGEGWRKFPFSPKGKPLPPPKKITDNQSTKGFLLDKKTLLYKNGGLHLGNLQESIQKDTIDLTSILYGDDIQTTFLDHVGNIWLGSKSYGLILLRQYPFETISRINNIPIVQSSYVFQDQDSLLWFDNSSLGTIGYATASKKVVYELPFVLSKTALQWNSDTLCFFSDEGLHYWFSKSRKKVTPITGLNESINSSLRKNKDEIILGTEGALFIWNGQARKPFKRFKRSTTRCYEILRLDTDEFIFATDEGIYTYSKGDWNYYHLPLRQSSVSYRCFQLISKNELLIGTSTASIVLMNLQTKRITTLAKIPPVLSNVWSMQIDRHNQLWAATNSGLVQLYLPSLMAYFKQKTVGFALNLFRYEQGIQNVEFNYLSQNESIKLSGGALVFSSIGGPVFVYPNSNNSFNSSLADIYIDNVTVDNVRINWQPTMTSLHVKEKQFVRLNFILPSFSMERVLNFEYRIKGFREYWTPVNSTISLDNLPAGNYEVEVRLSSGQRQLNLPVYVQTIHPYRWILVTILVLIGTLLLIGITYFITRKIQRRKNSIQSLKHQLRLLETEALRSQMNPHFIFNCLNTIQFLFITGNLDRANKYLSDFSSLMRKTMELLREQITTLNEEIAITSLYIELEQLQFDTPFEFRLQQSLKLPPEQISTPTLLFQIFVENAIIHGLKKTKESKPVLTIRLTESKDYYHFHICDNGPGFATGASHHTSRGMKLLRERFDLMQELYDWKIEFEVVQHAIMVDDIRTEIIITFDKKTIQKHT